MTNYRKFKFEENNRYLILREIETTNRTESGKSWRAKPDSVERDIVNDEMFTNYITAIPFFNNWGDGASCRAKKTYTIAGYLPTHVTTVSPYRETKKTAIFKFINKSRMIAAAGYREKEIINHAKRYELEYINGHDLLTLYTDNTDDTASGLYNLTTNTWRG